MRFLPRNINLLPTIPYVPTSFTKKLLVFYMVSLLITSVLFLSHALPIWLLGFGIISVVLFAYGLSHFYKVWSRLGSLSFRRKLLWTAFVIRLVYVIFIYYFNQAHYGSPQESDGADIGFYMEMGKMAQKAFSGEFTGLIDNWLSMKIDYSDMGYCLYLGIIYYLTGGLSDYIIPLVLKALYGAMSCVFIYKVASRHFGEEVGRIAGILCMLQANLIWWCGSMMKETEMVFLLCWYLDSMDSALMSGGFKIKDMAQSILIGLVLFMFRSALALVAFAAMFAAIVMSSSRVVSWRKKILAGFLVLFVLGVSYGDSILSTAKELATTAQDMDQQSMNMNWRTQRENGNQFAKYASAAVFAPLIFTIPFPNMVYTFENQEMLMMVNGGNYEKNVLSFFVVLVMFILLFSGEWRKHVFPISLLCGYLAALVLSVFAQSGRFHLPAIPLEMMFAAYGMGLMNTNPQFKRWFNYALYAEVFLCVAWGWFKLAGRGMI